MITGGTHIYGKPQICLHWLCLGQRYTTFPLRIVILWPWAKASNTTFRGDELTAIYKLFQWVHQGARVLTHTHIIKSAEDCRAQAETRTGSFFSSM